MNSNPAEERARDVLKSAIQTLVSDRLIVELDIEHPLDSEEFLGRLLAEDLTESEQQNLRTHVTDCLTCRMRIQDLREDCGLEWTYAQEDEEEPESVTAEPVTEAASDVLAVDRSVEMKRLVQRSQPGRSVGNRRLIPVAVAIAAAAMVMLPSVLRWPGGGGGLQSQFSTLAVLTDFGLSTTQATRSVQTPGAGEQQQIDDLRAVLGQLPQDPIRKLNLAAALLQNQETQEAWELVLDVRQSEPQNAEVLNALGILQTARREYADAERSFRTAAEDDTLYTAATLNLVEVLILQQQSEAAADVIQAALAGGRFSGERLRLLRELQAGLR